MKYQKGSFVTVPNKHNLIGLGMGPQSLYLWLCDFANTEGDCFPARSTLAKKIGCSPRAIDSYLKILENAGLVQKENRFKDKEKISNNYYLPLGGGANSALPRADSALPPRADSAHRTQPTFINSTQRNDFQRKSSFSKRELEAQNETRDVDDDGMPLKPRKKPVANSNHPDVLRLVSDCSNLMAKELGVNPVTGGKDYAAVKRALEILNRKNILQMVEDAIADGRAEKSGMSLSAILSNNQINKFRLGN